MAKKIKKEEIYKIISKVLKTSITKIIKTDNLSAIKEWDSLAHLDILSELDKKLGNKLDKIKNISNTTSVKKLINLLKKKSLVK